MNATAGTIYESHITIFSSSTLDMEKGSFFVSLSINLIFSIASKKNCCPYNSEINPTQSIRKTLFLPIDSIFVSAALQLHLHSPQKNLSRLRLHYATLILLLPPSTSTYYHHTVIVMGGLNK